MTLAELLATLADIAAIDYVGIACGFAVGLCLMLFAVRYDDARVFVEFYPDWHRKIIKGFGIATLSGSPIYSAFCAPCESNGV